MAAVQEGNRGSIDYVAILAKLRRQRAELDRVIADLERMAATDVPEDGVPARAAATIRGRRSTYLATVELLREAGRPMTNGELRQALAQRGDRWEINSFYAAARKRKVCEVEQVGRGRWALKG